MNNEEWDKQIEELHKRKDFYYYLSLAIIVGSIIVYCIGVVLFLVNSAY